MKNLENKTWNALNSYHTIRLLTTLKTKTLKTTVGKGENAGNKHFLLFPSFSSRQAETLWEKEKLLVTSNFSFSHCVFKRLVLQTSKNQGLFEKGFICCLQILSSWSCPKVLSFGKEFRMAEEYGPKWNYF